MHDYHIKEEVENSQARFSYSPVEATLAAKVHAMSPKSQRTTYTDLPMRGTARNPISVVVGRVALYLAGYFVPSAPASQTKTARLGMSMSVSDQMTVRGPGSQQNHFFSSMTHSQQGSPFARRFVCFNSKSGLKPLAKPASFTQ